MEAKEIAVLAAQLITDKKGRNVTILELGNISILCDYFVICQGNSRVQTQAIADYLDEELGKAGIALRRREGFAEGRWILLDFGEIIVHIFQEEERGFYNLERLWGDAPLIHYQKGQ